MLLSHVPDDDLFAMDHLLDDRSKEPIKIFLLHLVLRDASRAAEWLLEQKEFSTKATEAFSDVFYKFDELMTPLEAQAVNKAFFEKGHSYYGWGGATYEYYLPSRPRLLARLSDKDLIFNSITSDSEPGCRGMAMYAALNRYSEHNQLWSLIIDRANKDVNFWVRLTALKIMADGSTGDEKLRNLITLYPYHPEMSGPDPIQAVQNSYVQATAARLRLSIPVVETQFGELASALQTRFGFALRLAWKK